MLKFIENILSQFRSCSSRTRTYEWFLLIVSALLGTVSKFIILFTYSSLVRYDSFGVTSFVRALSLNHRFYETMLHFFRSSAYKTANQKHGHMFGGIGTAIGNHLNSFCIPMVPLLMELKGLNESAAYRLDVITRTKANCIAYARPEKKSGPHRGRPRKKGKSIKVMDHFESRKHDFITSTVFIYGKEQKVELAPTLVIEAYAHRFKIEHKFRQMKQQIHGFSYHFWNSKVPKLNKYKKKSDPLAFIRKEDRPSVLSTVEAIERFVLCSEISMGIIQMTALKPAFVEMMERSRYLRTSRKGRVSEATVTDYLRKHFFRLLFLNRHSHISRLILSMQEPDFEEDKSA